MGGAEGGTFRCVCFGLACLFYAAHALGAQAGPEQQVNTYTTHVQTFPAVCTDSSGNFVVVWESGNPLGPGQDGSYSGIFGQRFATGSTRRGSEFAVNTYTADYQTYPKVACAADAAFVVVWGSFGQDGSSEGVFAQRFAGDGAPAGSEFKVNSYTTGAQSYPTVASDADGNFIVAWTSSGQDGDADGVFARRYASSGTALGPEFRVNTYTTGNQGYAAVASDPSGNFVIAWQSAGQDGSAAGVFAQRFNSSGAPSGSEFRVNTTTLGDQGYPAVSMDDSGRFIIVWSSRDQDGDGLGIVGRRYGADGNPSGGELIINTYATSDQVFPDVAAEGAGDFVVTWASYGGEDGNDAGVFARRFASNGSPMGTEFQVNSYTTAAEYSPAVSMTAAGDFVISWASPQVGGDSFEIVSRWYAAPTPTNTTTPFPTTTATPRPTTSATPSVTRTRTATRPPTATSSPSPLPAATETPTTVPSSTPTATATPTATDTEPPSPTPTPPRPGDCNLDGRVTVDEILLAVNIELGEASVTDCEAADRNRDRQVTIEELVSAVMAAISS